MEFIDFHTHPYRPEDLAPGSRDFVLRTSVAIREHGERLRDPRVVADLLREGGVRHAVVLPEHCPRTSGNVRTETVLEICAAAPDVLIPFASVDPNSDVEPASLLRRYIAAGARGLKLYPSYQFYHPNDPGAYALYEVCQEAGIPVLMHIGSSVLPGTRLKYCDPVALDDVAIDFPDLVVVMAHGGRGFWYDRCEFLASHHANLYIDVAGLVPRRLREHFPRLDRIAHKLVFGSDWPAMPRAHPAENARVIERELGLDAEATRAILFGNAARLLGLAT
ncbi:MAG TPA: amidohydrolase family protein [Longimicrobiales bacterium]|nr:amidohydrolase family protein [Longimicrobiales bacterium]